MSTARMVGLNTLRFVSKCDVVLINPANLKDYLIDPLHPAYEYLSLVHRSDYMRAYFMHYYGGGYSDIKPGLHSWVDAFKSIENYEIVGYKEVGACAVAQCTNKPGMRAELQKNWRSLIGCGAFICQPETDFTTDWMNEVNELLNMNYDLLKADPGNVLGNNPGYPLAWTELLGDIFHPLVLKYKNHILQDDSIKPDFTKNYK
jgi:hypothetical protein